MKKRWMQSVIAQSVKCDTKLPWTRGAARKAAVSARSADATKKAAEA
ncbi:hypothetical protein ACP2AV_13815 [Aliiroseovarius sp. PTFE2010]